MKKLPPKATQKPARPRLSAEEKRQVAELVATWRGASDEIEEQLETIAATVVSVLFAGDAKRAFSGVRTRLSEEFARLGDAGEVPFSANLQSVMRRIGALNVLVETEKWHDLDWGQKTELLRLKSVDRIVEGAKHAAKYELKRAQIAKYVDARLVESGEGKAVRERSLGAATDDVSGFALRFGEEAVEKLGARFDASDEEEQAAMLRALDEAEARLAALRRRLKVRRRGR